MNKAAFMHSDPKSAKKTVKSSSFFTLSGSAGVKAAHKFVDEIDPWRGKPVSDIRRPLMKNVGPLNLYCFDSLDRLQPPSTNNEGESASLLLSSPGLQCVLYKTLNK